MGIRNTYSELVASGELRPDTAQNAVIGELERLEEELHRPVKKRLFRKAPDPVRGLYMWGGVGRGKSMLMDLLVHEIHVPKRRAHFHAFMQWTHDRINAARAKGVDDAIAPVADEIVNEIRFLAFDEMQITDITDAMIVGRLFERILSGGVTIVTTSNRPPEDLYKDGLNRQLFLPFINLIRDNHVVWHLESPTDHRQGRLAGTQSYFCPVDATARAQISSIWEELTGGATESLTLRVKGRDVVIPGFHNGVARARFYDLCGQPLGAADFLALADAARVLVLEDIPQLGRSNFNEARRFVTLIDALYEAKVKLVCSAAAAPEMLYLEGEGSFEFERTASRLREMQSDGWGRD